MTVNPCYLSAYAWCGKVEPQIIMGAWSSNRKPKGNRQTPKRPLTCEVVKWYNAGLISQSPQFDSEPTQPTLSTRAVHKLKCRGGSSVSPLLKDEMNMERENPHDVNPYDSKGYKRTKRCKSYRSIPLDVNPYDSKAIKRTKRYSG